MRIQALQYPSFETTTTEVSKISNMPNNTKGTKGDDTDVDGGKQAWEREDLDPDQYKYGVAEAVKDEDGDMTMIQHLGAIAVYKDEMKLPKKTRTWINNFSNANMEKLTSYRTLAAALGYIVPGIPTAPSSEVHITLRELAYDSQRGPGPKKSKTTGRKRTVADISGASHPGPVKCRVVNKSNAGTKRSGNDDGDGDDDEGEDKVEAKSLEPNEHMPS
ncbi:hypothetical protein QBC39DRAFT_383510 [Podospora conica]|nr:hypothetical protein QBC39DRAFT_383510 [Schizothecium conicum]